MAKKQPEKWQAKLGTMALNPIQAMELQDAVRIRDKEVQLEGRWFDLRYSDDDKVVFYKPKTGWVPMGYLNIDKLLSRGV